MPTHLELLPDSSTYRASKHAGTATRSTTRSSASTTRCWSTLHSFGAAASHSPVMHLQKVAGGRLFGHYMAGFETTWDSATP